MSPTDPHRSPIPDDGQERHHTSVLDPTPVFQPSAGISVSFGSSATVANAHGVSDEQVEDLLSGAFPDPRYQWVREVGAGGMGRVGLVRDNLLGREVALKIPLPKVRDREVMLRAFIHEALITARLEHPNIVPVYDFVVQEDGAGYVMRLLEGSRLSQILQRLANGDPVTAESYGRVRLLNIFQQIVAAVAFAHDRQIIHRDLKPSNVMVGAYGEVQVLDWGLACILGPGGLGLKGARVGQAPYMSPELYSGDERKIDQRSDIYALGAVLYEILSLEPVHHQKTGESLTTFMARCVHEEIIPPSARAPTRNITPGLDEICMRCLRPDPEDRYARAADLLSDVVTILEGTREREFRVRAAEQLGADARQKEALYQSLLAEVRSLGREQRRMAAEVKGWDPIEVKRRLWDLQDRGREADNQLSLAFHEAENAYRQALGQDPSNEDARRGLLEFYYRRFLREEEEDNVGGMRYFCGRVEAFGDETYNRRIQGDGLLRLTTSTRDVRLTLYRFEEVDRVLRPVDPRPLGAPPMERKLPMGSYLVTASADGCRPVRLPVKIGRLETVEVAVDLFPDDAIGEGFIYVPGGWFVRGGDFLAFNPTEAERVWVDSFAIATFPVTSAAYLEFVNALWRGSPAAAAQVVPQNGGESAWPGGGGAPYRLPTSDQDGDPWDPDFPVCRITWDQAASYCRWLSERGSVDYRLPTGDEWEKAGRGADGRHFPWGNAWDAGFCKSRDSRPGRSLPEGIGAFPLDESPYGVRDMAGGMAEWCVDQAPGDGEARLVRGGSWGGTEATSRLSSRYYLHLLLASPARGFRLCRSMEPSQRRR